MKEVFLMGVAFGSAVSVTFLAATATFAGPDVGEAFRRLAGRRGVHGLREKEMGVSSNRRARWCVLLLVAVLAACGSSSSKTSSAPRNPASTGTTAAPSSDGEKKIDACSLVSDDEAKTVLGEAVTKKGPAAGVGESVCEWDTATDHSITVSVGSPGTAAGDKLTLDPILGKADPVASLHGKGFYVAGAVDFAAGGRYNSVQVVSVAGDADRSKAEQLAVELTPKIATDE